MISCCSQKSNLVSTDEDLLPWSILKEMCFVRQFLKEKKRGEREEERGRERQALEGDFVKE